MKTTLMTAFFIGITALTTQGQSSNVPVKPESTKQEIDPEKAAAHQANKAEKGLGLTAEQKSQYQSFCLTRITTVRPLREKMKATTDKEEKKKFQGEVHAAFKAFDNNVVQILTEEQKVKWEAHKKEQKEKNAARKEAKVPFED
jgi:uncharacterized protein (DUF3084 family)